MPKTSSDSWVIEGLLGWVEGRFITKIMSANEWNYRLAKMRKSVCLGDDGCWPPLCVRHPTGVSGAEVRNKNDASFCWWQGRFQYKENVANIDGTRSGLEWFI